MAFLFELKVRSFQRFAGLNFYERKNGGDEGIYARDIGYIRVNI